MHTTPDSSESLSLPVLDNARHTHVGSNCWRSLEELQDREALREIVAREFPQGAPEWNDPVSRRDFLRLMGASLALAGVGGCVRQPEEKIYPYVRQPEEIIPGRPLFFATAITLGGVASGLLVESHEGRPTKIEGNPQHPASLGATDAFAQASLLTLYDPDRSQTVVHRGSISTWDAFVSEMRRLLEAQRQRRGAGLRILTQTVTSPTLAHQIRKLLAACPEARWHQYEPAGRGNVRAGARLAFGEDVATRYRLAEAEVILSLGANLFLGMPGSVRYTRDFAARRGLRGADPLVRESLLAPATAGIHSRAPARGAPTGINRLYVAESTPTTTGAKADHRLLLRPGEMEAFARRVAAGLGVAGVGALTLHDTAREQWAAALTRDLQEHGGSSVVIVGDEQPPVVHALAHALNDALGAVGRTVDYSEAIEAHPVDEVESLRALVNDMASDAVELLVILGGNPVYDAPADLRFEQQMSRVATRVHLSLYEDETSRWCHWHIPEAHYLESWSDARAYDGTVTIIQPLIAPLYRGSTAHELLAMLLDDAALTSYEIVRNYWREPSGAADFEAFWRRALHDGLVAGSALPSRGVALRALPPSDEAEPRPSGAAGLDIIFRPDPTIWDGRFANNGWLQELPKPLTTLTWDNAVHISPATAARLGLAHEDVVELHYRGRIERGPVWITPGNVPDAVTVHLGYGRTRAGRVGNGRGFNAYALRTSDACWHGSGLEIRKTGERYRLARTQNHHRMEDRHLVRSATLEEYRRNPSFAREPDRRFQQSVPGSKENGADLPPVHSLYPEYRYEGYAWGMVVDQSACVGCSACVVACQAENNIPVVGQAQVLNSREMHWLRIDHYFQGHVDNPETYFQPMLCQHCEKAPCEVVCPVVATSHSAEGINEMTYNRCVGTRYCSNNCPYKVRRFNFFQYSDIETPSLKLMRNPNVTVRNRGVMEKCTYCIQRINAARIEAKNRDGRIRDGELLTACQQACPAQAIIFGDINDPNSRVAKLKAERLNYGLLAELNTQPRTSYLAVLKNPNPQIPPRRTE
jgi:molybdopterin-containing oxidoreductase family iron-sulfur binding subunit